MRVIAAEVDLYTSETEAVGFAVQNQSIATAKRERGRTWSGI